MSCPRLLGALHYGVEGSGPRGVGFGLNLGFGVEGVQGSEKAS